MSDQPFDQYGSRQSTKDVAKEESKNLGSTAKENAGSVAQTAGTEAQQVVGEAKAQAASLFQQVREDVTGQARDQQQRAAGGLHGLAGELTQMADGTDQGGMAAGLARQAAEQVDTVAGWLENRQPADLLEEVRRYARRNPGTFLAACAAVGFVGGRLTRGLRDDSQDGQQALAPAHTGTYANPYAAPMTPAAQAYGVRPAAGGPATTYVAGGTAPVAAGYEDEAYIEGVDPVGTQPVAGADPLVEPLDPGTDPLVEPLDPGTQGTGTDPYTEGGDRR